MPDSDPRPTPDPLRDFLAPLDILDLAAWQFPNGRLRRLFGDWGFSVSSTRDLREEVADYDIDGEVSMLVPRTRHAIILTQADFAIHLKYELWNFRGLLQPQQVARAGGSTELHCRPMVDDEAKFLAWRAREMPPRRASSAGGF